MEFKINPHPYSRTKEKVPNPKQNPTVLKTIPCTKGEFIEIMSSYGDVSKKTTRVFIFAFAEEFNKLIGNCERINLKFGSFVGGYEDKRRDPMPDGMPSLKRTGYYSGVLYYKFPAVLKQGYLHRLEEERKEYEGIERLPQRRYGDMSGVYNHSYPVYLPGKEKLVSRQQFVDRLAINCRITSNLSETLLEALELTVIELIRSNKYFIFPKSFMIGGYPRIASAYEKTMGGFKGEAFIVKEYCPFCRVTVRYNKLCKGTWIGDDINSLMVGEQDE